MDLGNYYNYWKKYRDEVKLVTSIHNVDIFDLNETMNYVKNQGKGPHLVVEDPSVRSGGNSVDNVVEVAVAAILVIDKLHIRKDKAKDRNQLLIDTFEIAKQIKIQMLADAEEGCTMLRGLQYRRFELDKVGPLSDSLYGWRLQFEYHTPLNS